MYDYKVSKTRIEEGLSKKIVTKDTKGVIPTSSKEYEGAVAYNGYITTLVFDLREPNTIFKNLKDKDSRLIKSLVSEVKAILSDHKGLLGISYDGYAITANYNTPDQPAMTEVFRIAYRINTFMVMFNQLIKNNGYKEIKAGIGIAASKELALYADGLPVYLGPSQAEAHFLASKANKKMGNKYVYPITMNKLFRENIVPLLVKEHPSYPDWLEEFKFTTLSFYHCNILQEDFARWVKRYVK